MDVQLRLWSGASSGCGKSALLRLVADGAGTDSGARGAAHGRGVRRARPDHARRAERRFAPRASRWQVYRTLRWPASKPALFSSLRITSTFSLMGSIVGEDVAGGGQGLGYKLITAKRSIDAALVMAITLVATVTGVVVFLAVAGVERLVLSCRGQTNL
jgi:ABC-type nitrate/sulfonate/bicarbonate transport system permease component